MKVICSYCRKEIEEKKHFSNVQIVYSTCEECYDKHLKKTEDTSFNKYLNSFDVPVFIVDENVRILAANKIAETLVGKPKNDFQGLLGGEALGCAYASLPDGCGKTVHCVKCAIRNTVTSTLCKGILHRNVPAKLHHNDEEIELYLSTEIIGSCVCIKVKMAEPAGQSAHNTM